MPRLRPSDTLLASLRTLARRFAQDNLAQTAGSLTFTTLISLVPLLTVVLAVFTAFPAFDRMQGQIQAHLAQTMLPDGISDKVYHYLSDFAAKAKSLGHLDGGADMADMHGIERPAKNADQRLGHGLEAAS